MGGVQEELALELIPGRYNNSLMIRSLQNAWPIPGEADVRQAVTKLVEAFDPIRIIVFGSFATGTAQHGSDLDLLVVLPEVTDKRETAIAMRRVLAELKLPKDVFVTTPEEIEQRGWIVGSILKEALTQGSIVYEREDGQ